MPYPYSLLRIDARETIAAGNSVKSSGDGVGWAMNRTGDVLVLKVTTDEQILATREVMRQLRPAVPPDEYLAIVNRMKQKDGYELAAAYEEETVRAVAGYRFMEMLAYGKVLYVDDLSTDDRYRSKGHGKVLLDWLKAEAKAHGCAQLHLDSGVQRESAHRFYFRERLVISSFHFRVAL